MRLLQVEKVSDVTVLRDNVDSKSSLTKVSVVVVVELLVETTVVDVLVMISVVVSEIKTSQDSICSCLP